MQLSDRNSRLLLVLTGIGLFGYILKVIIQTINSSFSNIYIGSFPIGIEQVFSVILFINALLILGIGIIYCYFELHSYGNFENTEQNEYHLKADKFYRLLLKISYISFFMALLLLFFIFGLLPFFLLLKKLALIVSLIIMFVILLITIKKWRGNWFSEFIQRLNGLKKYSIHFSIFTIWLILVPSIIILGINLNLNPNFDIEFKSSNNPEVTFIFKDHAPDKMPEEIIIKTVAKNNESVIKLKKADFDYSFIEVKETVENNAAFYSFLSNNEMFILGKSDFIFEKSVNLNLNKIEDGYIEIKFIDQTDINSEASYRIVNKYKIEDGKVKFNRNKFDVDL